MTGKFKFPAIIFYKLILEPVFTISNDRLDGPLAALRR